MTRNRRGEAIADDPGTGGAPSHDRPWLARAWYQSVRFVCITWFCAQGGLRATGRQHMPESGGALLVSNHLSYLDVFILGMPLNRPLNYVARSTLFLPGLRSFIRSVGGFPIQRDGMGASGLKETLRRLRRGGIVVLFPEGTRTTDGRLGPLKSGIAVLAEKGRVPVVPAAIAGTFEAWPRHRPFPGRHAFRIHYGPAILPSDLRGLGSEAVTALLHERIAACHREALCALARDLQIEPPAPPDPLG